MNITSYFSLPTDLAAEMRSWSEFISGQDYDVELRSMDEIVSVRLEKDEGRSFVRVRGSGDGPLFHRVLGVVVHVMSGHNDDVWVTRWSDKPLDGS